MLLMHRQILVLYGAFVVRVASSTNHFHHGRSPPPPCAERAAAPAQDARKGVKFVDLPPVLNLQLKRFEYDFQRDTMVKVGAGAQGLLGLTAGALV